jgi:hypothetical protein
MDCLTRGSLSGLFMEPETSSRNTRLVRGFSAAAGSYPLMAMCTSLLPGFQGESMTDTVGSKGTLLSAGAG